MIEGPLKHRDRVEHIKTRGQYIVSDMCLMKTGKIDDTPGAFPGWESGVIYSPAHDPGEQTFVRPEDQFRENFRRVE